jgi:coproporphyrinogen III oxidase
MAEETLKEARGISGIYFRFQNPETNKWGNRVFEDLPESEQDKILDTKDIVFTKNLCKALAKTLYNIAEQFDITTLHEEEKE